jgi:hypothetical protein
VGTDDGRIYLLDMNFQGIIVTDTSLRPLGRIGRAGSGPGEFREPIALAPLGRGRIVVLDRALRRLTFISDTGRYHSAARVERMVALGTASEGMCIVDGVNIIVYGLAAAHRVRVIDTAGVLVRNFAPIDTRYSSRGWDLLATGRVACDPSRKEVVITSRFSPAVQAFIPRTGALTWADTLRPFRELTLTEQRDRTTIASGPGGFSLVVSAWSGGGYRAFQTAFESRMDDATVDSISTYTYSLGEGRWLPVRFDLPVMFPLPHGLWFALLDGPADDEVVVARFKHRPAP